MLHFVYACIVEKHDLRLVGLAALLCIFACFAAVNLFLHASDAAGKRRLQWMSGAAIVFGSGVWATHFVAELAYQPGISVGYDFTLTVLSIVVAVAATAVGMAISLYYGAPVIGGGIIGGAVAAMHYTGMAALRVPAQMHWNFAYVLASLVISVGVSSAALRVLMMGPSLRYRMIAALLFVLGICGLHFVGMTAVTLELDPSIAASGQVMAPSLLAVAIAAVSVLIVALAQASSLVDDQLARRATKEAQLLTLRVEERTAELRKAQEDLLREERLSILGQVTATMAHELRNPLSAIRNTVYAIGMATAGRDEAVDRLIARLERNVVRCDRIVSDLIDFTRMRKLAYEIEIPDQWLSALLDDWALPERITLVRNFGAGSVELRFDVERMRRAITNLLDNATQAMAERENSPHILAVGTLTDDKNFVLTIQDTGPGIPAETLTKVFEPLFSTKAFGTGLGLPTVKQIVEQHGGEVELRSEVGKGTQAIVRLPLRAAQEMAA